MGEIKLRVWVPGREEMVYSDEKDIKVELTNTGISFYRLHGDHYDLVIGNATEAMQYIGLKDKHGKDVYKGDIVSATVSYAGELKNDIKLVSYSEEYAHWLPFNQVMPYDDGRWIDCLYFEPGGFEVIGNIYETPELLNS